MERSLTAHWADFSALRRDYAGGQVTVGIDPAFARRWVLFGRGPCPLAARLGGYLLLILFPAFFLGAVSTGFAGESFLSVLLFVSAYLDWRFLKSLSAGFARSAAIEDEELFNIWFRQQRLSVRVNRTGAIVWHDPSD